MSKILIGGYGIFNYLNQEKRRNVILSQKLINVIDNQEISPGEIIHNLKFTEFITTDSKGIIGIVSPGTFYFMGIGKTNSKCLIKTDEENLLIFSKGEYDVNVNKKDIKKIIIKSENNLKLTLCYKNFSISIISKLITEYFENDKIIEIFNDSKNLDENWNDILSISLKNSVKQNNFSNPKIEIIPKEEEKDQKSHDISEITNKYNFFIIYENFKKNKNEIIDDPFLVSIISQDYVLFNLEKEDFLNWIMSYVELFTIYTGKFFKYYQNIEKTKRHDFIRFLVSQKIASLYLKVDSEKEIDVVDTLNDIIKSNDNRFQLIKESIEIFGLVTNENSYYKYESNYYYNFNDYSLYN